MFDTIVWAHRGASAYAPENTLEAFKLAAEMHADGVELDVHICKSGEVMVNHDESIDRTSTGKGFIRDMTYEELMKYSYHNNMDKYLGARMPTLREVYELLAPTGLTVNVELKTDDYWYEGIEEKCLRIAEECGMKDKVLYSSFNHKSLERLLSLDPTRPTGLLYTKPIREDTKEEVDYAVSQKAKAVHPYWKNCLREGYMQAMKDKGIDVNPWTVNEQADMKALMEKGIHAIITNNPDIALKAAGR